jgi:rubrerythrin
MIAERARGLEWLVRLAAPLVWRSRRRIATKLEGFAATEAGSALDMLKAAELTDEPQLRRLFFRHAMDEARHAQMFRDAARAIDPDPARRGSDYHLIHATRQNLLERMGLVRFVSFVHLAEKSGAAQFHALEEHFAAEHRVNELGGVELADLFARIGKDERFHVKYSQRLLQRWEAEGQGRQIRLARLKVRLDRAIQAWRRAGRLLGDLLTRGLLSLIYLAVLPVFVVLQRWLEPERPGWKEPRTQLRSFDDARRQY